MKKKLRFILFVISFALIGYGASTFAPASLLTTFNICLFGLGCGIAGYLVGEDSK